MNLNVILKLRVKFITLFCYIPQNLRRENLFVRTQNIRKNWCFLPLIRIFMFGYHGVKYVSFSRKKIVRTKLAHDLEGLIVSFLHVRTYGSRYSRMDQVKFVKDSLQKIWSDMFCLGRPYHFKFFKDCLPKILLEPFLNSLTHIFLIHLALCR